MPAAYRFLDRWVVPYPVERVYAAVGEPLDYPRWRSDVFVSATGDPGPPPPGNKVAVVARGFLPYKLRFTLETIEVEEPTRIKSLLYGDFEGSGEWHLRQDGDTTHAELDWRPIVNKSLVKTLTPVLRPLFRSNHSWTMKRGQERILAYLAEGSTSS
jgi:Polyketide cyclase / dehydrase and lipid transport